MTDDAPRLIVGALALGLLVGISLGGGTGAVLVVDTQRSLDACEEERADLFERQLASADRLAVCEAATQLGHAMHHVQEDNYGLAVEALGLAAERLEETGRLSDAELLAEVSLQPGNQPVSQRTLVDAYLTVTENSTP